MRPIGLPSATRSAAAIDTMHSNCPMGVDWNADRPLLRLRDSGPGLDELRPTLLGTLLDEDGRGLFLVRTFAERFERRPAPEFGTEFLAGLPLRRSSVCDAAEAAVMKLSA